MTTPRTARLLLPALALAGACGLPAIARADTASVMGHRLVLTTAGSTDVSIQPDRTLGGTIHLSGDSLDCLQTQSVADVAQVNTGGCGDQLSHLDIAVPPGFDLVLTIAGSGDVTVGDIAGVLAATLNSGGNLTAERAESLTLTLHGSGDASVKRVRGAANIEIDGSGGVTIANATALVHASLNGSGDLGIGEITAPAVDIEIGGSGDATLGGGSIDALKAQVSGGGDLAVAARVATADLHATGGSDISLTGPVTRVKRDASGGSSITVGGLADSRHHSSGADYSSSDDNDTTVTVHGGHHILAGILVLVLLFFAWRTVQRNGGWSAVRGRATPPSAPPSHPGVLAVRDALARVEAKLARVENYVTSREFELHRKFRELDRK
jgi:hypothetical protein